MWKMFWDKFGRVRYFWWTLIATCNIDDLFTTRFNSDGLSTLNLTKKSTFPQEKSFYEWNRIWDIIWNCHIFTARKFYFRSPWFSDSLLVFWRLKFLKFWFLKLGRFARIKSKRQFRLQFVNFKLTSNTLYLL